MKKLFIILVVLIVAAGCDGNETDIHSNIVEEPKEVEIENSVVVMEVIDHFLLYLVENSYGADTVRLNQLADYAYQDLRKTPFKLEHGILTNNLSIQNHTLNKFDNQIGLTNGKGYFYAKIDSNGVILKNAMDFGLEIWELDTSVIKDTDELKSFWRMRYHPQPLYTIESQGKFYVLYTRSSNNYEFLLEHRNYLSALL